MRAGREPAAPRSTPPPTAGSPTRPAGTRTAWATFSIKQQMRDLKVQLDYKRHALELIDDQMSSARTEFERLSAGATE